MSLLSYLPQNRLLLKDIIFKIEKSPITLFSEVRKYDVSEMNNLPYLIFKPEFEIEADGSYFE